MLNHRLFAVALVWLTLTAVNSTAHTEAAASPKAVFVIVDGIPADVIERVPTPTIDAIARVGGDFPAVWGLVPDHVVLAEEGGVFDVGGGCFG